METQVRSVRTADCTWEFETRADELLEVRVMARAPSHADRNPDGLLAAWSLDVRDHTIRAQTTSSLSVFARDCISSVFEQYVNRCATEDWPEAVFDVWQSDGATTFNAGTAPAVRQGIDALIAEGLRWSGACENGQWSATSVSTCITGRDSVACIAATGLPWGGAFYLAVKHQSEPQFALDVTSQSVDPPIDGPIGAVSAPSEWRLISAVIWNDHGEAWNVVPLSDVAATASPNVAGNLSDVRLRDVQAAPTGTVADPLPPQSWHGSLVGRTESVVRRAFSSPSEIAFALSLGVYGFTRLWKLEDFPIYFHGDEAFQVVAARRLVENSFRNELGVPFPLYFSNGGTWAPLVTTYLHVVTSTLLGMSVSIARGSSAVFAVLAGAALALFARDNLGVKTWWALPLVFAAIPTWFLHSRTTFETAYCTSGYAIFLWCYGKYRNGDARWGGIAVLAAAFTFYTYTNGQLIIGLTGALLAVIDARHHWRLRRKSGWIAAAVAAGVIPYVAYARNAPGATTEQLWRVSSYLVQDLPIWEKLRQFVLHYGAGLDPRYWFLPNTHELSRHMMLGYGYVLTWFFPFVAFGLATVIVGIGKPSYRLVAVALVATPIGASLADVGITRVLSVVVPLTLLALLGVESTLNTCWQALERLPKVRALRNDTVSHQRSRIVYISAIVLWIGLALPGSFMLRDALANGPRWFTDYGLYGQQWGAVQVFREIRQRAARQPTNVFYVSSTWANGTDLYLPFFVPDLQESGRVRMGNVRDLLSVRRELTNDMVWVMTADEVELARNSKRFRTIDLAASVPYPDGTPGFSFARLEYVANVEEVVAAERAARVALRSGQVVVNGERLAVRHSYLDAGGLNDIFDNNPRTLGRFNGGNPATLEWSFPTPRPVGTVTLAMTAGTWHVSVAVLRPVGTIDAVETDIDARSDPIVTVDVPEGVVGAIRLMITSRVHTDEAIIHLRDVTWQ